jgi:hypothetical protein
MRGLTRMLHRHEGRVLQHVSHAHTHPRFTCTHASTFHMHTRVLHHVSPHRAAACFTCTHASTAQTLHTNAKGPRHTCVHHQCMPRSVFLAAGLEIKHTRVPGPGVGPESNVQANIRPRVQHTTPLGFRVSKWGFTLACRGLGFGIQLGPFSSMHERKSLHTNTHKDTLTRARALSHTHTPPPPPPLRKTGQDALDERDA